GITDQELAGVAIDLGEVQMLLGRYEDASRSFALASGYIKDDPLQYAQLAEKRHRVPMRLHQYPEALRWLRRGLTALEGAEGVEATVERAKLMASSASVRQLQSQPADAIEWAQKAIAEAQRARTGPQEAEGLA